MLMKRAVVLSVVFLYAVTAVAADVALVSFEEGELKLNVTGSGAVTLTAQIDYKYISNKTGAESLARSTSAPVKMNLEAGGTPVTIDFQSPDGAIAEAEVVVFINGNEKFRETIYY
jgi:hypothetical protein